MAAEGATGAVAGVQDDGGVVIYDTKGFVYDLR